MYSTMKRAENPAETEAFGTCFQDVRGAGEGPVLAGNDLVTENMTENLF